MAFACILILTQAKHLIFGMLGTFWIGQLPCEILFCKFASVLDQQKKKKGTHPFSYL